MTDVLLAEDDVAIAEPLAALEALDAADAAVAAPTPVAPVPDEHHGKGGSYEVNYYTLNGQGDDGLDQAIAERVQNQVRAGGDRAVDEIKTMSPSNILQIALWGLLGLAAFAVVKPMLGGSKS